ncbi:amidase [Legionella sp. PC1000]|uniref:amidase n=1 Tax=Legionella sp. PC1000 TaxID=2746060 RepID=UPI0018603903|nr:amidase [Legionella sp. PC1000]QLZ70479.1 amidase [Legionella sp. PC1000]
MPSRLITLFFTTLLSCQISIASPSKVFPLHLEVATIHSLHNALAQHQISCLQLTNAYLERIKKYNLSVKSKAPINAFSELNPSVLMYARQLDDYYKKTGQTLGPLHCIPVILKDNIDSFDTTTTSGSFALLGSQPIHDAFLVKKLRDAGAIILGKGGMDEFAWGMFGISSRSGRIGNAYDPNQNPGGSSGGPAAAVSAHFALLGIGTDNSGSVRIPSAFNGLVGLRPSTGLISQNGIFPMGNLDGAAGPIARTTQDLAILLDVIAQPDLQDHKTLNIPRVKTYSTFLKSNGLKNKKIGIVHNVNGINPFNKMSPHIEEIIKKATNDMQKMGATLIDITLPDFNNDRQFNQAGEIQDVNQYLASFPSTRKSFRDICESNRTRNFGSIKDCLHFMKNTASKFSVPYKKALENFKKNKTYVEQVMNKNQLDALLMPITSNGSATYDAMKVNTWRAPISSNSGLPALSINVGYSHDTHMPIGVELISKQYQEGTLIEIAYAYETQTKQSILPLMPEENLVLLNFTIPELNNLFTLLGENAYEKFLIHSTNSSHLADDLTAERFREITANTIQKYTELIGK